MALMVILLKHFDPSFGFQKYIYFDIHTNKLNFYIYVSFLHQDE